MTFALGRSSVLAQRTRVIDAEVARALGRGTTQVVLLGSGYDGRSLRFRSDRVHWFEVDRPVTLADKRRRLDVLGIDTPGTTSVGLDLLDGGGDLGGALEEAGHDAGAAIALRLRGTARLADPGGGGHAVCDGCATGRPG